MIAPSVGQRVKYLGATLKVEHYQELPERIGREGIVVYPHDANGNEITSIPEGIWPVNVKWDNGDPVQTCFEGEVKNLESDDEESAFDDDESS